MSEFKFTAIPAEPRPALIVIKANSKFWHVVAKACTEADIPGWKGVPVLMLQPHETFETLTPERVAEIKKILNEQQL